MRILIGMPAAGSWGGPIYCEPPFVEALRRLEVEVDEEVSVYGGHAGPVPFLSRVRRVFDAAGRIRRRLSEKHYDLIFLNTSLDARSLMRDLVVLRAIRSATSVPVFLKMHGSDADFLKTPVWRRPQQYLFKTVDAFGVLSSEERMNFINAGCPPKKLIVVKNAFETDAEPTDIDVREEYAIPVDTPILLFSSRLIPAKGLADVLHACALLRQDGRELVLICVGDGAERSRAEQMALDLGLNDTVKFTGYISESEASAFHSQSDVFVFPTFHNEGFPLVIMKALSAGTPIITTRIRGMADHLSAPDNCLWVDPRSPRDLAEKIKRLLDDRELQAAMARENPVLAKKFGPDLVAGEYLSIFNDLLRDADKAKKSPGGPGR